MWVLVQCHPTARNLQVWWETYVKLLIVSTCVVWVSRVTSWTNCLKSLFPSLFCLTCLNRTSLYEDKVTSCVLSPLKQHWMIDFAACGSCRGAKAGPQFNTIHPSTSVSSSYQHRQIAAWNPIWRSSAVRPLRWNSNPAPDALCEPVQH